MGRREKEWQEQEEQYKQTNKQIQKTKPVQNLYAENYKLVIKYI